MIRPLKRDELLFARAPFERAVHEIDRFLVGQSSRKSTLLFAMTGFGLCKGFYDSGIFASLYDAIEPRARGTAAGLMNTVGWGGGALGPLFVGVATKYGGKSTKVENMSDAISFGSVVYLVAAALVLAAMFLFTKRQASASSPGTLLKEGSFP